MLVERSESGSTAQVRGLWNNVSSASGGVVNKGIPVFRKSRTFRNAVNRIASFLGFGPAVFPPVPADGRVLFRTRDRADFGFLSNFCPAPVVIDGERWPTVEHYYQAQKSHDPEYRAYIREAQTPGTAKRRGDSRICASRKSKYSWFREHPNAVCPDWDRVRVFVMVRAVATKFHQNRDLARVLRATNGAELIEDSRRDSFWGGGKSGKGKNWLGKILMETRARLEAGTLDPLESPCKIIDAIERRAQAAHVRRSTLPRGGGMPAPSEPAAFLRHLRTLGKSEDVLRIAFAGRFDRQPTAEEWNAAQTATTPSSADSSDTVGR